MCLLLKYYFVAMHTPLLCVHITNIAIFHLLLSPRLLLFIDLSIPSQNIRSMFQSVWFTRSLYLHIHQVVLKHIHMYDAPAWKKNNWNRWCFHSSNTHTSHFRDIFDCRFVFRIILMLHQLYLLSNKALIDCTNANIEIRFLERCHNRIDAIEHESETVRHFCVVYNWK